MLGGRAVIADSYERIHRSNVIGMGVLPLEFRTGETRESLGLDGEERYEIKGIAAGLEPRKTLKVEAVGLKGEKRSFEVVCRIDTPVELDYYRHGGIPPFA